MIATTKSRQASKSHQASAHKSHSNWDFLPPMLSGAGGMIIGWAIAFTLGWV